MRLFPLFLLWLWTCITFVQADLTPAHQPILLTDINRDGFVDEGDYLDERRWTGNHSALFLHATHEGKKYAFDQNKLWHPELAARMKTVPMRGLGLRAKGQIVIKPEVAKKHIRIFEYIGGEPHKSDSWTLLKPEKTFNSIKLFRGITLAIDSRTHVTEMTRDSWDGEVELEFKVIDKVREPGSKEGKKKDKEMRHTIYMKQAPFILHHNLQRVEMLFTSEGFGQQSMQSEFARALIELGSDLPERPQVAALPHRKHKNKDKQARTIWIRDDFVLGYTSIPSEKGITSLRVILKTHNRAEEVGNELYVALKDILTWNVRLGAKDYRFFGGWKDVTIDDASSLSNIEVIPPYVSKSGIPWNHGRVIVGEHTVVNRSAPLARYLQVQDVQRPFILNTGWLHNDDGDDLVPVSHLNQMFQFIPYPNKLGWTIAMADTNAALEILRNAQKNGHGSTRLNSFDYDWISADERGADFLSKRVLAITIDEILADDALIFLNTQQAQKYLDAVLNVLLSEIPLTKDDVLRVPSLWRRHDKQWTPDGPIHHQRRQLPKMPKITALFPQILGGIPMGTHHIVPKPWGPVINGTDIFEEAVRQIYEEKAGKKVVFMDDYMTHHVRGGELYRGTNVMRRMDVEIPWWNQDLNRTVGYAAGSS